jgi:hypothetical protein
MYVLNQDAGLALNHGNYHPAAEIYVADANLTVRHSFSSPFGGMKSRLDSKLPVFWIPFTSQVHSEQSGQPVLVSRSTR